MPLLRGSVASSGPSSEGLASAPIQMCKSILERRDTRVNRKEPTFIGGFTYVSLTTSAARASFLNGLCTVSVCPAPGEAAPVKFEVECATRSQSRVAATRGSRDRTDIQLQGADLTLVQILTLRHQFTDT